MLEQEKILGFISEKSSPIHRLSAVLPADVVFAKGGNVLTSWCIYARLKGQQETGNVLGLLCVCSN